MLSDRRRGPTTAQPSSQKRTLQRGHLVSQTILLAVLGQHLACWRRSHRRQRTSACAYALSFRRLRISACAYALTFFSGSAHSRWSTVTGFSALEKKRIRDAEPPYSHIIKTSRLLAGCAFFQVRAILGLGAVFRPRLTRQHLDSLIRRVLACLGATRFHRRRRVRNLTNLTRKACGGARRLACQHCSTSLAAPTGMAFLHCLCRRAATAEGLKHSDSHLRDTEKKLWGSGAQ